MSANPIELFSAYGGLTKVSNPEHAPKPERRGRQRIHVHWPVRLFRDDPPETVESVTQNLSSRGFYCHSNVPLVVGEIMACTIRVPAHDPGGKEMDRLLDCTAMVTRVEAIADGNFGIACRLEEYHVARTHPSGE
jgi:hypothetical protein